MGLDLGFLHEGEKAGGASVSEREVVVRERQDGQLHHILLGR